MTPQTPAPGGAGGGCGLTDLLREQALLFDSLRVELELGGIAPPTALRIAHRVVRHARVPPSVPAAAAETAVALARTAATLTDALARRPHQST